MLAAAIKVLVTSLVVVAIVEVAKRSTLLGGFLASLPLTSLLAIVWLYVDSGDTEKVRDLSVATVWLVLPSLILFPALAVALRRGLAFESSLAIAIVLTAAAYGMMLVLLRRLGIAA